MTNGSSHFGVWIIAVWLAHAGVGCTRATHIVVATKDAVQYLEVTDWLAAHPLPAGQNISATRLGRTDTVSYHLVQVRDREAPHLHATHDMVVTVLRGAGTLYVDGQAQAMRAGDIAVVPRGTPHYFANHDSEPSVAFVTFAPPYDGTDQVPVEARQSE